LTLESKLIVIVLRYSRSISDEDKFVADQTALEVVMGMGFTREQATKALKATNNNLERAADWIFSHQAEIDVQETEGGASPSGESFRDGSGRKSCFSNRESLLGLFAEENISFKNGYN
jgi:hypothetical protein